MVVNLAARRGAAGLGSAWHGVAQQDKARNILKQTMNNEESNEVAKRTAEPFERSAEVERLVKAFAGMGEGDEMTYKQVESIIMENPQSDHGRSVTLSARRIARKEFKIVIQCEPSKGFIRVKNELIPELPAEHRARIRRRLKLAGEELAVVDVKKLSNGAKSKFFIELSWVGTLDQFTKPKLVKQISDAVKDERLAVGDVLKLCAES